MSYAATLVEYFLRTFDKNTFVAPESFVLRRLSKSQKVGARSTTPIFIFKGERERGWIMLPILSSIAHDRVFQLERIASSALRRPSGSSFSISGGLRRAVSI